MWIVDPNRVRAQVFSEIVHSLRLFLVQCREGPRGLKLHICWKINHCKKF
jgi:hypothetical protein